MAISGPKPKASAREFKVHQSPLSRYPEQRSVGRDRQHGGRYLLAGIRQRHEDQEEREDHF
jgi:hypothetical protein